MDGIGLLGWYPHKIMEESTLEAESVSVSTPQDKVIVHAAYPVWRKHALIAIARAKELQDDGAEVLLTYCNSRAGTCAVNYVGSSVICSICRSRVKKSAAAAGLNTVPLNASLPIADDSPAITLQEKKSLAEGVQSGVTSTFRQLPGDHTSKTPVQGIKKRYYQTTLGLLGEMKALLQSEQPDRLEVFNGRQACSRFCLIAARSQEVPFNTMEVTARLQPIIFRGHTAHDRKKMQERILQQPIDFEIAESFYQQRRKPRTNKYAKGHAAEFIPPCDNGFKKKVSIFLSSQDEFESLGQEWKTPFPDYATVVREVCKQFPDHLFCVRFHPNQANMVSDVTTPFKEIETLSNTVVYFPTDSANTYTLIDWSDLVITFGSTVTVEACWMGKPVISLGPSFFDQLNVSYNPQSMETFLELLTQDLKPKNRQAATQVAQFQKFDFDPMRYLAHNGKTLVPNGIKIYRPWLSRLARTADDLFCRWVKTRAKWASPNKHNAA